MSVYLMLLVHRPILLLSECIKLLLERGADPKQEDEDSTTPLELARNNETKSMLHMSLIQSDVKRDIIGKEMNCGKIVESKISSTLKLKRKLNCKCGNDCLGVIFDHLQYFKIINTIRLRQY